MKPHEKRTSKELRKISGNVEFDDKLTCFLYLLMRDELSTGIVEQLVMNTEGTKQETIQYTNGWLAKYAKNLSNRLKENK